MTRPTPMDDPDGPAVDVSPPDETPVRRRLPWVALGIGAVVAVLAGVITFVWVAPYEHQPTPHALPSETTAEPVTGNYP